MAAFGANEWLIEELYEKYRKDKGSVDPAWWDFFEDYEGGATTNGNGSGAPAAKHSGPPTPAARPAAPPRGADGTMPASRPDAAVTRERSGTPSRVDERSEQPATEHVRADLPPAPPVAAQPATAPYAEQLRTPSEDEAPEAQDETVKLRGVAARTATNMEASIEVPVATSVRAVPAKVMVDNRIVINSHLKRSRGGKISFTHLIGFAMVEALGQVPDMNKSYTQTQDGKPAVFEPAHVAFGLAIDLPKPDGTRTLVVPSVKKADEMDFAQFWAAYEELVRKARNNKLTVEDYAGTTISLTNPGGIGTVHSIPRLMKGQGTIIGVGAMDYPAEFAGSSPATLARLGISKVLTLTSTYDHRIIQGAASGEFLKVIEAKLLGTDGFYDRVFTALRVPYEPVRWLQDVEYDPDTEMGKPARITELIHAYRSRGHLIADTDPLSYRQRRHPDLDVANYGLTLWDLERKFPTGGFGGAPRLPLREILGQLRDAYCRTTGSEYMHIQDPAQRKWFQDKLEKPYAKPTSEQQLRILSKLNAA